MPKIFLSLCFLVLFAALTPAHASDWVENEHFRSRLAAVPDGGNTVAVLEIELEDGWHTYGQEPGDAGLPPRFDWAASENLESVEIDWPETIQKREADMFEVNAYEGAISFPLKITPVKADEDVALNLDMKIMVCHEICVPEEATLSLPLTAASLHPAP